MPDRVELALWIFVGLMCALMVGAQAGIAKGRKQAAQTCEDQWMTGGL